MSIIGKHVDVPEFELYDMSYLDLKTGRLTHINVQRVKANIINKLGTTDQEADNIIIEHGKSFGFSLQEFLDAYGKE